PMRGNQTPQPIRAESIAAGAQVARNPRPDHFQGLARQLTPSAFGRADLLRPALAGRHPPDRSRLRRPTWRASARPRSGRDGARVISMTGVSVWSRLRALFLGRPRDLSDRSLFHKVSLVAVLAWVGLGADGLSSSCYGPEESYKALGAHPTL